MTNPSDISIAVFNGLVACSATSEIYDETAPKKLADSINSLIVYEIGFTLPAYDYSTGVSTRSYAYINCYAKDKANGVKNTAGIKAVVDAVTSNFKMSSYRVSLSSIQSQSRELQGYHGQTIIYRILK